MAQAKSLHPDSHLRRGEVQQYGEWLVGCDNNAECTMLGFPEPRDARTLADDTIGMGLRISLSGTIQPSLSVEILPSGYLTHRPGTNFAQPFVLVGPRDGGVAVRQFGYSAALLREDEAAMALGKLMRGDLLLGYAPLTGRAHVRFAGDRFSRAYRAMHARREQLVKQLAAQAIDDLPGELPDGSTMPLAGKHRRIPALPTIVSGFVPLFVANMCGDHAATDLRSYRFANGAQLWSYACDTRSYPTRTFWEMAPQQGGKGAPLGLPDPRDFRVNAGTQGLENAIFDFDFGILREYRYRQGREDCGSFRAWGFTDNGWQLLERREMPLCNGLHPEDWIRTHYLPTDGPGPDA